MEGPIRVGVLALQGSFREHMTLLNRIPGVEAVEVSGCCRSASAACARQLVHEACAVQLPVPC